MPDHYPRRRRERRIALMPNYRTDGYISAIAQSGRIGFSLLTEGRPKELSFNYIPTTGNDAALEELDSCRPPHRQQRDRYLYLVHGGCRGRRKSWNASGKKALEADKPIIVTKVGRSDAGQRATSLADRGACRCLYRLPRHVRALWNHCGRRHRGDRRHRFRILALESFTARRQTDRHHHGVGWRRHYHGGYSGAQRPRGSGAGCGGPRQIDAHLPAYGTS